MMSIGFGIAIASCHNRADIHADADDDACLSLHTFAIQDHRGLSVSLVLTCMLG